MIILGIESTCDETGVGLVEDGRKVLASVVSSSVDLHKKYGGVVPEVAAREQVRVIIPVIAEALKKAFDHIDAIAVAHGPGLVGSLLVGVETAKTLAIAWNKPLIPVNHLIGHVYANFIGEKSKIGLPAICLIVSGGHTDLILMTDHGKYKWLGGTVDDASGEAFDKAARILGLGYPGGPEVEHAARKPETRNPSIKLRVNQKPETRSFKLPRPMINEDNFDFSFSGLKTAVVNLAEAQTHPRGVRSFHPGSGRLMGQQLKSQIAREFQNAVIDVLLKKTLKAARKFNVKSIVVGGGVAANSELRNRMADAGIKNNINVFFPSKELSIDNGAMIASAAFYNFKPINPLRLQANPGLYF